MKKLISALLCATILCSATACSKPQNNDGKKTEDEKPVPMRYVSPGAEWEMQGEILDKVNNKLQNDGVNIEVSFIRIPWDAWAQKTQLMIAGGEEFEMLHVMQDLKTAGLLYGQGAIVPLNEYLAKDEFSGLKEKFTDQLWNEVSSQGKVLAVPALTTADEGKIYGDIYYRKDIAEKLNLKIPTTVDETIDFAKVMQEELTKESGKKVYIWGGTGRPADWYLRSLDQEYSYVDTNLSVIKVTQDGEVHSWLESEEFKKSCELYERLNNEGLIHPDALSLDHEYPGNEINFGRWALGFEIGAPANYEQTLKQNVPGAEIGTFCLSPEKNDFIEFYTYNCNAIPSTSKNPESALQFLQWLYSSKENHDLFIHGVESETYTASTDNRFESIMGADGKPLYEYDEWQIAYLPLRRFEEVLSDEVVELSSRRRDLDEDSVISVHTGFMFDSTPVADAAANLSAECKRVLSPLQYGMISYEDGFDSALSTLKAAGLDEYIAEYRKQFKEFLKYKQQ